MNASRSPFGRDRQVGHRGEAAEALAEHAPPLDAQLLADVLGVADDRVGAEVRQVGRLGLRRVARDFRADRCRPPGSALVEQQHPVVLDGPFHPARRRTRGPRRLEARTTLEEEEVRAVGPIRSCDFAGEDGDLRSVRLRVIEWDGMLPLGEDRPRHAVGRGARRRHRLGVPFLSVIGTALATLGRRLPRVVGISKLALSELIEPLLLTPKHVELVSAFIGIDFRRIKRHVLTCVRTAHRHQAIDAESPTRHSSITVRPDGTVAVVDSATPFPALDTSITHILVVSDMSRSRTWYVDVLGATLYREYGGSSVVLSFAGAWLLLVTGGGPTDDKPDVTLQPPVDPDRRDNLFTIRVTDCREIYELLRGRGAMFLTPPVTSGAETRCFFRDPDGHLFEISEYRLEPGA